MLLQLCPNGWEVSTPAQQGLDPKLICATGLSLAKLTGADPHGVVVARRGVLVYEQYFAGDDMRGSTWIGVVPHDANTLHNMESITNGVIALLVGIALDRGLLRTSMPRSSRSFPNTVIFARQTKIGLPYVICCRSPQVWIGPSGPSPSTTQEISCGGGKAPPIHIVSCWSVPSK